MRRFSSTVRRGKSRRFSGTCAIPIPTTAWGGTGFKESLLNLISPPVGSISFEISRNSVVLPAPFGPITATDSPARTSRLTPNSAWKPPYAAETFSSESIGPQVHLDDFRVLRDFGGLALRDHHAVVEHHAAVDDAHQHAHDVLHPDDGDAALGADLRQHVGRAVHLGMVEAAE